MSPKFISEVNDYLWKNKFNKTTIYPIMLFKKWIKYEVERKKENA